MMRLLEWDATYFLWSCFKFMSNSICFCIFNCLQLLEILSKMMPGKLKTASLFFRQDFQMLLAANIGFEQSPRRALCHIQQHQCKKKIFDKN